MRSCIFHCHTRAHDSSIWFRFAFRISKVIILVFSYLSFLLNDTFTLRVQFLIFKIAQSLIMLD